MKKIGKHIWIILAVFIISRLIFALCGIQYQDDVLLKYWQYLDLETLRHNLFNGVWYDHAQPPLFNIFLGIVLKVSGSQYNLVFALLLKLITLINTLLLYSIIKKLTGREKIALILALIFVLSPASVLLENELFYTTFISMWLLISVYYLAQFTGGITWKRALGFFLPLAVMCLTRSIYHIGWLLVIVLIVLIWSRKKPALRKLFVSATLSILLVGGWYAKNYYIFGRFTTSTWMGMNLARQVFHDHPIMDSSRIEAFEPFSKISFYNPFISKAYEKKYTGLNDLDLLPEHKNLPFADTLLNMNNINYIEVSDKYMAASTQYIKDHKGNYLKNVVQSCFIFFAPATRYPSVEKEAKKLKYYDLVYSFNLSQLAEGKQQRRYALTISALPKMLIYLVVFFILIRVAIRKRSFSLLNWFAFATIGYVFVITSFLEHYENMRFRYEIEPLFIVLLAQALVTLKPFSRLDSNAIG